MPHCISMIEVFFRVIQKLESADIPYMAVGSVASVASMVYGEPRLTHDMDLVLDIQLEHTIGLNL